MSRKDLQSLMKSGNKVVAVKTVSLGADLWSTNSFLPGDILDQVNATGLPTFVVTGGKSGLQKELRKLVHVPGVVVTVKRGGKALDIQARVVVEEATLLKKQQYLLAGYHDPSYLCTLIDSTEEECKAVQENTLLLMERAKNLRIEMEREHLLSKLANTKLTDSYAPYPWNRKMQTFSPVPGSGMVFSLLVMPHQPNKLTSDYLDVEETSARAMAWLSAAQASGVPIAFVNIQTEPFLLQGPGFKATGLSRQDPDETANAGVYTVQAYDGLDIEIVRAVRLWYVPAAAELAVDLRPDNGESRLGVGISRTEEGFCHISSVDEGTAADRAGLIPVYQAARKAGKLLVISRVGGMKVTPWMVIFSGAIRCFDTATISGKLKLHRQTGRPLQLHVMLWDGAFSSSHISVDDKSDLSEVIGPIVVEPSNSGDSANGDTVSPRFRFIDETASDSMGAERRPASAESRRFTESLRYSDLDLAPEGIGLSFRFEVPDGGSSYRESSLRTPLIDNRPSSPVFKSL